MAFRKTSHPGVIVYRRGDVGWYAKWRDPHSLKMVYQALNALGFSTKKEAATWLADKSWALRQERQKAAREGRSALVAEAWPQIENQYRTHFSAEHGPAAADRLGKFWLRHFRDFLAARSVRTGGQLSERHIAAFRDSLALPDANLAPATRNRILGATGAFLKWCARQGYVLLTRDRIGDALVPYKLDRLQPRVLSISEMQALLSALVAHDTMRHFSSRSDKRAYGKPRPPAGSPKYAPLGLFAILALLTGARPGEVLSITWRDVDLVRGELRVWGSKTKTERTVPLHDSPLLRRILGHLSALRQGETHVCGDWHGGRPIEIHDRQWRRVTSMASVQEAPMKVLRSTCVAHVASASPDSEFLLEARFGHGAAVSKRHYRQPLHGLSSRGNTVEDWLGVSSELHEAARSLGLLPLSPGTRCQSQ